VQSSDADKKELELKQERLSKGFPSSYDMQEPPAGVEFRAAEN
jgi:hypothetical protein